MSINFEIENLYIKGYAKNSENTISLSRLTRKPIICIGKNKDADQQR